MEKISPIKEKILLFIERQGITKADFCEKTGISYANMKGKGLFSEIGGAQIGKILYAYNDLSPEWLLTGQGSMLKSDEEPIIINKYDESLEGLPLYNVEASAGFGSFEQMIGEENIIARYNVPLFKYCDFMMYVKGSSMYPKYGNGDIIACKILHDVRFLQWHKIYVIATRDQGFLVKRVKKSDKEESICIVSDNKEYDPFDIPKDEILGYALVVGVIRLE